MKSAHDAYISKAADFAVPILEKIRTAMHKACPNITTLVNGTSQ